MNPYIAHSVLHKFVGTDTFRPAMAVPRTMTNYTFASDSHCVIGIDKNQTMNYPEVDKVPNFETVFNDYSNREKLSEVNLNQIFKALAKVPTQIILDNDCRECDGRGATQCRSCDSWHECTSCNGSGKWIDTISTHDKTPVIKYESAYIKPEFLLKCAEAFLQLCGNDVILSSLGNGVQNALCLTTPYNEVTIVVMGYTVHDENDYNIIPIE